MAVAVNERLDLAIIVLIFIVHRYCTVKQKLKIFNDFGMLLQYYDGCCHLPLR